LTGRGPAEACGGRADGSQEGFHGGPLGIRETGRRLGSPDVQAAWWGWVADYPSAATWIPPQYGCAGNQSGFCDRAVDRLIKKAIALQARDPSAANALWSRIDRMLTDRAPFVHLLVGQLPYFVSDRVGNYQYHPVHELLLDQLWIR
jgi:peptide/nickel transport system substrate-binding protein